MNIAYQRTDGKLANQWVFPQFIFDIQYAKHCLPIEGWLAWEYNPFHNFTYNQDVLKIGDSYLNLHSLTQDEIDDYYDKGAVMYQAGTLLDMDTDLLQFSLNNPVQVECQTSYDGSTNVIFTDGLNLPKMINSRFTPLEGNRYTIIDRYGNNDTNIYDYDSFDIDTRLFNTYRGFPTISVDKIMDGGNLLCGSYVFYFRFCDADGNETDIVAQTPNIQLTKGADNNPSSKQSGYQNENTFKMIRLRISDTINNYDYVTISYSRITSDALGAELKTIWKIDQKYPMTSSSILISGNEYTIPLTEQDINERMMIVDSAKTECQCQNMLFLGNLGRRNIPYEQLTDLSLRLLPVPVYEDSAEVIGMLDPQYIPIGDSDKSMYYNYRNAYDYTGYFPSELYRFAVVYVLHDGSYTNAFPVRGALNIYTDADDVTSPNHYSFSDDSKGNPTYDNFNDKIDIDEKTFLLNDSNLLYENSKGVCRFMNPTSDDITGFKGMPLLHVKIEFRREWINEVKKYAKAVMVVRQKRRPLILCQGLSIGMEKYSGTPTIKSTDGYILESFIDKAGRLNNTFSTRRVKVDDDSSIRSNALLVPELFCRTSVLRPVIDGSECVLTSSFIQPNTDFVGSKIGNTFSIPMATGYKHDPVQSIQSSKLFCVDDLSRTVYTSSGMSGNKWCGTPEDGTLFSDCLTEVKKNKYMGDSQVLRGIYTDFVLSESTLTENTIYNICIPGYSEANMFNYYEMRVSDKSLFYACTEFMDLDDMHPASYNTSNIPGYTSHFYNGDCYINQVTIRMNRNFNDPENPANDIVVDNNTWVDYWKSRNKSEEKNIGQKLMEGLTNLLASGAGENSETEPLLNSGDVNAVPLGHWVTFTLYTSTNLIKTDDMSFLEEAGMMGNYRSFYPYRAMYNIGRYKMDDSNIVNLGMSKSASVQYFKEKPDTPYIKDIFQTRVAFSAMHNTDGSTNKYRYFYPNQFMDLPIVYGGITKLVEYGNNIICVFEHAIAQLTIQPESEVDRQCIKAVTMLSNTYGSQWIDSVVRSGDGSAGDMGSIYGVDTVSKKIWMVQGSTVTVISELHVDSFLNENITFGERELEPILGVRDVKTHYNHGKRDVMFTFYDNLTGFNETSWSLCYNEELKIFTTFYSWIPSQSENIDTMYFSFDRTTAKYVSKIWTSWANDYVYTMMYDRDGQKRRLAPIVHNETADKVYLMVSENRVAQNALYCDHKPTEQEVIDAYRNNKILYTCKYELVRDNLGYYLNFVNPPWVVI